MKVNYLRFVKWNEDDNLYVGYCPDLFIGGVCHGKNEQKVYAELCSIIDEDLKSRQKRRQPFPRPEAIVALAFAA
jgi:hypothetical protein